MSNGVDYDLNRNTVLLGISDRPEYLTRIYDRKLGIVYSRFKALTLINHALMLNGFTIDGQRKAMDYNYPKMNKLPVVISPFFTFVMIPTHSPSHPNCVWVNMAFCRNIKTHKSHSIIKLSNGKAIELPISRNALVKQIEKGALCLILQQKSFNTYMVMALQKQGHRMPRKGRIIKVRYIKPKDFN
ncbi:competence protein ComK [Bacillus sp. RG28]|uniref:Competence protein ComK n=1 Tax=Gottfriedia endophytica TaxID=2820819 RepID=A0A940NIU6_9BACI|nr:competence protein ComK [Gottfriedia endophytica]MBP0725140.1 competence protein ComK [Gottfriedia endophytica]